jgi:hypothetical protein
MEEGSAACVALKATKYKPDTQNVLSFLAQQQSGTNNKICLLAFHF